MGLLKRFRASSSASNRAPTDAQADFTPPPMPPPPIQTHSHMYASVSRASVADSTSASASGMETPKSSKSFWKRKTKGKDKDAGYGLPYESTSPSPAPPMPQYQGERSRNSSFVHVPAPRRELSGYEDRRQREGSSTPKQEITPKGVRGQLQSGMLGKLDFEAEQGRGQGFNHAPEPYSRQHTTRTSSIPFGTSQSQQPPQPNGRPVTAIFLERPKSQAQVPTAEPTGRMSQEEMEHLTSPEKAPASTPNTRRMSIQEEPGSPTPRKGSLPPQDLTLNPKPSRTSSTDNHNALSSRRPSANRRNSFIPLNPFSKSRGSMNNLDLNLDQPESVDDGSFQVMSFRHVSGASDYQDPDPYKAPERQEVTSPVTLAPAIPTNPPSRPMSRAASLASLDDHISTAAKVSAGAFRKGVRRPSSTYLIDHDHDDEDDDVPLGMLRHSGRESSSASLSSVKDNAKGIQMRSPGRQASGSVPTTPSRSRPAMPTSPSAAKVEQVISHTRSKTMPLISPDEIHPNFPSPTHSPVGSPKQTSHPELPDTGYFAAPPIRSSPPVEALTGSPEFDFSSLDYPVSAFSTSPQATKAVAPLPHSRDLEALITKTSGLAVSIPSPAGGSTLSSAISPAPIKQRQETDKLDEDLIIRSMAVYGDDTENDPPTPRVAIRKKSHSSLYNDSMSSDNSTIRSPLSERLGNLVGPRPMGKPSLVGLNTPKVEDEKIKSPGTDATVSPIVAQTPRSSFARVTSQPLKGGSSSEGTASDSDSASADEMPPPPVPATRPVNVPRSSFANAAPRPVPMFKATRSQSSLSQAIKADSDSEEDLPLARIKSKASRSSLAVNQSGMRPATIHSESPKPAKMSPPMSTSPASFARRASVPNTVAPPPADILGSKIWDASPASSQSGLTGDSSSVQPITPSDREMDGKISRDSFPPAPMYHTAIRPELGRPQSVMSSASNMDDATRQRMKEMWQAQYMAAAASKAFEEEWERQSNVSGSVAPSVQSFSPYTPQPQPQSHSHPHPQQYPMPAPMPHMMGYNYPPQYPMYPPPHHAQQMPWAPPEQSMYAYGPSTQSVYGGEFGPPAHGMPQSPYRPMSMMGFPASYSATNLQQYSPQPQQMTTSQSSYFNSPPPQQYTRSPSHNDLTPPKKGLINQIPTNSPKGVTNRRSQLGISVYNADDRERERGERGERSGERGKGDRQMQPPTSWRRSTTVPVMDREDHSAPRRKRQSSYLVN